MTTLRGGTSADVVLDLDGEPVVNAEVQVWSDDSTVSPSVLVTTLASGVNGLVPSFTAPTEYDGLDLWYRARLGTNPWSDWLRLPSPAASAAESSAELEKRRIALRPFHAKVATGQPVTIAVAPSDSIGDGASASSILKRFSSVLVERVREDNGYAAGGLGYVDLWNQPEFPDHPVTDLPLPSTNTNFGLGRQSINFSDGTSYANVTAPLGTTDIDILYVGTTDASTGFLQYSLDGGAPVVVNTGDDSTTSGGHVIQITGLSAGSTHTVLIAWQAGPAIIVEGVMFYAGDRSSGVRIWEAGQFGYRAADYAAPNNLWIQSVQNAVVPDLGILAIGSNDYATGVPVADAKADLIEIVGLFDTVLANSFSLVLLPYYDRATGGGQTDTWAEYVAMYHEVADSYPFVCVCDLGPYFGPWDGTNRGGLTDPGDLVHPTDYGHKVIGNAIADFLRV